MPARHDEWDQVAQSQRRAASRYQKENIQQMTVKLNVRTDMDVHVYDLEPQLEIYKWTKSVIDQYIQLMKEAD